MKKIAVACENQEVAQHFGHCEEFVIYDVENQTIANKNAVANPGHKPGFLPNYLNDLGVKVIIAGGMGQGAVDIFNDKNIEVIVGARGNVDAVMDKYLNNNLKSTNSVCHEHMHEGHCNE